MKTNELLDKYLIDKDKIEPLFLNGDSFDVLKTFPDSTVDCIITSPPYWGQRQYNGGGIGLEKTYNEYISNLMLITKELYRVLKDSGSFWLNIGDTYRNKNLLGIPWRTAIKLVDEQNWIIRNSIIWNKHKGGLASSKDKLRNIHENIFHFVKNKKYYYETSQIRSDARKSIVKNGSVVSATGVSGVRYKRQIELSTALTNDEKILAFKALQDVLNKVKIGEITDFRMIIRGQQRVTHSDSKIVSGRAGELINKGFYFLFYHPDGTLPSDVWDIIPEDTQKRKEHYAVFPEDICRIPILSTCPKNGVVLDPFSGSGTTSLVAFKEKRKSIGIDISSDYIDISNERINEYKFENSGVLQFLD